MTYKVIGVMSGSSLDGIDIVYTHITEKSGTWSSTILAAMCVPTTQNWQQRLSQSTQLHTFDYLYLHKQYGVYIGECINNFIEQNKLAYQVDFVAVHGHTTFHSPEKGFTAQLGCGANIAAQIQLPVIDNLRAIDMAYQGQGAPIVPIGEQLLFSTQQLFLNLGGIANLSFHHNNKVIALDICPANAVCNALVQEINLPMDTNGQAGQQGKINEEILRSLNESTHYFQQPYPKSLSNHLGKNLIAYFESLTDIDVNDKLRTYYHFIAQKIKAAIQQIQQQEQISLTNETMLISGGGAYNDFLVQCIQEQLSQVEIKIVVPDDNVIQFKEALTMCLIGILRWRESFNVLKSASGAKQNTVNGSIWYANKLEE